MTSSVSFECACGRAFQHHCSAKWPTTTSTAPPERVPLDQMTSDQLDELYVHLARARRAVRNAEGSESWMAKHLTRQDSRVHGLTKEVQKQRTRAVKAEAAIARVRALHHAAPLFPGCCAHCTDVDAVELPCPTLTALDQPTA